MEKNLSNQLEVKHILHAARESVDYIDKRRKGEICSLKTPWEKYNRVAMGGIEWWTIHTIAGMSGSGKTAIVNQLETSLDELNEKEEFNILSFNFEMLARNLVARKLANKLSLTTQHLHSGNGEVLSDNDYEKVLETGKKLSTKNIFYVEKTGTVEQIEKTILSFVTNPKYKGKFGKYHSKRHHVEGTQETKSKSTKYTNKKKPKKYKGKIRKVSLDKLKIKRD